MKTFKLKVLTGDEKLLETFASSLTVPTYAGEITIRADHIPLLSSISIGNLKVEGNTTFQVLVQGGIVDVKDNNEVTVLVDQKVDTMVEAREIELSIARAKQAMQEKISEEEFATFESELERALFIKRMKGR